jgi:hypothetical protein
MCLFVFVGSGGWNLDPLFPFLVVSCSSPLWFLGFPFVGSSGWNLDPLSPFLVVSCFSPLWFLGFLFVGSSDEFS